MRGLIVFEGPPEEQHHICDVPNVYDHNIGTVYLCTCGSYYQITSYDSVKWWKQITKKKALKICGG